MINATQIRKGMIIIHLNEPHRVRESKHRAPGKGAAFVRVLLKNLRTGASYEHRFASGDAVNRATLDHREMEFLYRDGNVCHFMDTENYEQIGLDRESLAESWDYLKEGQTITVEFFDGNPIGVELPSTVELKVVETEAELKGATASNSPKPAKLETGVTVQVPPFIREGELIRVDPSQGRYIERAR